MNENQRLFCKACLGVVGQGSEDRTQCFSIDRGGEYQTEGVY